MAEITDVQMVRNNIGGAWYELSLHDGDSDYRYGFPLELEDDRIAVGKDIKLSVDADHRGGMDLRLIYTLHFEEGE